ncbi:hypothetical protein O1R50_17575 [Glycomyces luteolus]|uniref:Uncharacterized protein n=1 Tax=Glycomyces luteolus TaxID=2670330 RepID=A0A9X3PCX4_9ACTN|nr:hypothetical protein [Glycomyces luteolus]MDA1361442.1 hypothetical protein [Glycomyces luteolus]
MNERGAPIDTSIIARDQQALREIGRTGKTELYTTPETGGNVFTCITKAHPNLGDHDTLVISCNVNSFQGSDLYADASLYRPRYINVHAQLPRR